MELTTEDVDQEVLDKYMHLAEQVEQGHKNALDIYPKLHELKKALTSLEKELKERVVEERQKYSYKEEVVRHGYEITTQSRMYPSYKEDDEYSFLDQKLKNRKKLIKKATERGKTLFDSETGEAVDPVEAKNRVYPVLKFVGSS